MFGPNEKDISQLLEGDSAPMIFDDLEILEEYLNGVVLPPLDLPAMPAVEAWSEPPVSADDAGAEEALQQPEEESAGTSFTTSTMAEIYVSQGFIQRAIDIYEEMLTESPLNEGIIQRLSELQDMLTASNKSEVSAEQPAAAMIAEQAACEPAEEKSVVATLESWLANINRRR
jgi:hypothetical protein